MISSPASVLSRGVGAVLAALVLTTRGSPAASLTLETLVGDVQMSPKRLVQAVSDFAYEFHAMVQPPDVFLEKRAGDCDDFAVLADVVLKQRQFHTRLVHVRMVGRVAHAVCYVQESQAYLDYNNRRYLFKLTSCKPRLRDIAEKVADSFEANWTSVSEFLYDSASEEKAILITVLKTDRPEMDPDHTNE